MEANIDQHAEEIQVVSVAASQESVLEGMLAKIATIWKTTEFEIKNYKEQKDVYIVGSVEDITADLDDSLVTISTILVSVCRRRRRRAARARAPLRPPDRALR